MSWMAVAAGASAALGAGSSIYGANQAADAQMAAGKKGLAEQQRQYNLGLQMLEPQRMLGYQALADIAGMYGYATPGYQPANQLLSTGGGMLNIKPTGMGGGGAPSWMPNPSPLAGLGHNPLDMLGDEKKSYGASINPLAGTVDVQGAGAKKDSLYTNYLQTGNWEGGKGGKGQKVRSAIDALRAGGYSYGNGQGTFAGSIAPTPAGQPGNMSKFFASPDYQFRRDEGIRGIEQGAAARGGALSGNALRGVSAFNSNLAAGEFGNYISRLMQMAGMGSAATNNAVGLGQNYGNNFAQTQQNMGDARASGIVSGVQGATGALNQGMQNWMLSRYLGMGG